MKTLFWRSLVCLFMLLAIIGALLPGMPTTVFLILAAWAASKGWPQMDAWLMAHPKYGVNLRNWREHGTVARKVKLIAVGMMLLSGIAMLFTNAPFAVKLFTDITMLLVAIWLFSRPEPQLLSSVSDTSTPPNSSQGINLIAVDNAVDIAPDPVYRLQDADIIIDLATQQLWLMSSQSVYPISSAKNGIGELEASGKTPRGWHRICEKFGENAPQNAVFVARQWTGEVYDEALALQFPARDWILSRILWLDGLEDGFNRGAGRDSKQRYIYIHGTPDTEPMRQPYSHGCIRMRNTDVIALFEQLPENALVWISEHAVTEQLNSLFQST